MPGTQVSGRLAVAPTPATCGMEAAGTQQPPPSRQEREREQLRQVAARRKEERWLNPSAASLEREHEFMTWLEKRPQQHGDEPRNDTFEIFLMERRKVKEKERLRLVAEQRRAERQQRRAQAPARKEAEPLPKRPRGRPRDPATPQRRLDKAVARVGTAAARSARRSFEPNQLRGDASCSRELRGWPRKVIWWRRRAEMILRRGCSTGRVFGDLPLDGDAAQFKAVWKSLASVGRAQRAAVAASARAAMMCAVSLRRGVCAGRSGSMERASVCRI